MSHDPKSYYECHVTIICPEGPDDDHCDPRNTLKDIIKSNKWKFSQIDGDIALGDGVKCYATTHYNARTDMEVVVSKLHTLADLIASRGFKVIRRKVELVVYDDRSTKVLPGTCEGACVGCHLDDLKGYDQ